MRKGGKKKTKLDPKRLVGPNGEFISSFEGNLKEGYVTIGYLEEACEWVYHHNNMTNAEKLERITSIEAIIASLLSGEDEEGKLKENSELPFGMPFRYIPVWSKKLIEDEKGGKTDLTN